MNMELIIFKQLIVLILLKQMKWKEHSTFFIKNNDMIEKH